MSYKIKLPHTLEFEQWQVVAYEKYGSHCHSLTDNVQNFWEPNGSKHVEHQRGREHLKSLLALTQSLFDLENLFDGWLLV
jgi:hypothetical protein